MTNDGMTKEARMTNDGMTKEARMTNDGMTKEARMTNDVLLWWLEWPCPVASRQFFGFRHSTFVIVETAWSPERNQDLDRFIGSVG